MNLIQQIDTELEIAIIAAAVSILLVILITLWMVCRPDTKKKAKPSNQAVRSNSFHFSLQPLPSTSRPAAVSVNIESFTMSRSFSVYMRSESPRPEPRFAGFVNPGFSGDDFIDHLYHLWMYKLYDTP